MLRLDVGAQRARQQPACRQCGQCRLCNPARFLLAARVCAGCALVAVLVPSIWKPLKLLGGTAGKCAESSGSTPPHCPFTGIRHA